MTSEEFWLRIAEKALWAIFWIALFFGGTRTVIHFREKK